MVIKNVADVAKYLEWRIDDVYKLEGRKRAFAIELMMSLYHNMMEADRYRYESRGASKSKKRDYESLFNLSVCLAQSELETIEELLSKVSSE